MAAINKTELYASFPEVVSEQTADWLYMQPEVGLIDDYSVLKEQDMSHLLHSFESPDLLKASLSKVHASLKTVNAKIKQKKNKSVVSESAPTPHTHTHTESEGQESPQQKGETSLLDELILFDITKLPVLVKWKRAVSEQIDEMSDIFNALRGEAVTNDRETASPTDSRARSRFSELSEAISRMRQRVEGVSALGVGGLELGHELVLEIERTVEELQDAMGYTDPPVSAH